MGVGSGQSTGNGARALPHPKRPINFIKKFFKFLQGAWGLRSIQPTRNNGLPRPAGPGCSRHINLARQAHTGQKPCQLRKIHPKMGKSGKGHGAAYARPAIKM